MKKLCSVIFVYYLLIPLATAQISYSVSPSQIKQQINDRGVEQVYQELFSDQTAANMVLLAIDSGDKQWLDLASMLFHIDHPRTQAMLTMSVGEALQWSPAGVLGNPVLLQNFPLEKICSLDGLYEWRRFSLFLVESAINRRLLALRGLGAEHNFLAKQCSKLLKDTLKTAERTMDNRVPK